MATTIYGLDIGHYSVKVSSISASFRSFSWEAYREYVIPHAGRQRPERAAAQVLGELAGRVESNAIVVCALPGDRVMSRFIDLPINVAKRIDQVLGFELQSQIPLGVEEMQYSHQVVGPVDDGDKVRVFAAAVHHDMISRYLSDLQDAGIDPRVLTLDTTSYVNLYDHVSDGEESICFVDVGHRTTKVCIVQGGRLQLARSIGRGGQAVTEALATRFKLEFEEAEELKHERGELSYAPDELGAGADDVAGVCQDAMEPVLMAIRQSCQSFARESGTEVGRVLITGGGSRLEGFLPWLSARLTLPVSPIALEQLDFARLRGTAADLTGATKSLALGLQEVAASQHTATINFRTGPYGYEGDYQFLQEKLRYLAAMAAVLLLVASVYAVVKNNALQQKLDEQRQQLSSYTKRNLDKRFTSFAKALKYVQRPAAAGENAQLFPPMTAIAALDRITEIQAEVNRGDRAKAAGGPPPGRTAPRGLRKDIRERLRNPRSRPTTVVPGFKEMKHIPTAGGNGPARRPPGAPPIRRDRRPDRLKPIRGRPDRPERPGASRDPKDGPERRGDREDEGDEEPPTPKERTDKVEFDRIEIDVYNNVMVRAETHRTNVRGKDKLEELLRKEPCFVGLAREGMGKVSTSGANPRHEEWERFKFKFTIKCPKKGEKGKAGKGEAKGKKAKKGKEGGR